MAIRAIHNTYEELEAMQRHNRKLEACEDARKAERETIIQDLIDCSHYGFSLEEAIEKIKAG